jgi:hypothetical protein
MPWLLILALTYSSVTAPPLEDLWRFPPLEVCRSQTEFLRAREKWLADRLDWDRLYTAEVTEQLWDCRRRIRAWDYLENARDPVWNEKYRRYWLGRLRTVLGPVDYFTGRMPDPLPLP